MKSLERTCSATDPVTESVALRAPDASEYETLLAWLDVGLRSGRSGRLVSEYPTALGPEHRADHVIACVQGRFAAHALGRRVDAQVEGLRLPVGLIGLVYSDPAFRGRGLARRCVEHCLETLRRRGAWLALLWSDLDGFYTPLGFRRCGSQWSYLVTPAVCRAAAVQLGEGGRVGAPRPGDWPLLEALYAAKPTGAVRAPGELERLAQAPDCVLRVARRGERAVAYAASGRGDDLQGIVHEWAGDPAGVVACLQDLLGGRDRILWMLGPHDEPPAAALRSAEAVRLAGDFAWVRLLDAEALWNARAARHPDLGGVSLKTWGEEYLLESRAGRAWLDHGELASLLLGPRGSLPAPAREGPASARAHLAMSRSLPWPMFLWGFDSI